MKNFKMSLEGGSGAYFNKLNFLQYKLINVMNCTIIKFIKYFLGKENIMNM